SGRAPKIQPTLEGVGLIEVVYPDLGQIAAAMTKTGKYDAFASLPTGVQRDILQVICDTARRERALRGDSEEGPAGAFMNPSRFGREVVDQLNREALFHSREELPRRATVLSDTMEQG